MIEKFQIWRGISSYDEVMLEPSGFTLHIEGVKDGRFSGFVKEDFGGIPEIVKIAGSFSDKQISFIKYYKATHVIAPDGKITSLENSPYEVEFNGHLYSDLYQGKWNIAGDEVSMVNGVAIQTTCGSWQLWQPED